MTQTEPEKQKPDKYFIKRSVKKLTQLKSQDYNWVCANCHKVYKQKRQEPYEDGHGGRYLDMCRCGCDIYLTIDKMIEELKKGLEEKIE